MTYRWVWALIGLLVLQGCSTIGTEWKNAEDRRAGRRFIPVELWTGQAWQGGREQAMEPVGFTFGSRGHKQIKGPKPWRHPISGKTLQVYERINETTRGTKQQYYTLNPEGNGLVKVYDRRPGKSTRIFSENAVLFPLGWWQKGEQRSYTYDTYVDGKKEKRIATIRMRRLSFTYKDVKHAMKYDWMLTDAQGKLLFHERFIYGSNKSLMYFKNRMAK